MTNTAFKIVLILGLLFGKPQLLFAQFDADTSVYWGMYNADDTFLGETDTSINSFQDHMFFRNYDAWNAGALMLESSNFASWGKMPSGNEPFGTLAVEDERLGFNYSLFHRPVTRAYYHFGSKNEQLFLLEHHQPISNRTQIDLKWVKGTSNGFLLRGREDFYNFNLQALSRLVNNNLYLKLNFENQSIQKNLIGKIDPLEIDTLLNQGEVLNFEVLSSNLNANINNRKMRGGATLYLFLDQWKDSSKVFQTNRPHLKYNFNYERYSVYFDNDIPDSNGFYRQNYLSSDVTFEKYQTHYLKHDFSLVYTLNKKVKLNTAITGKYYQYIDKISSLINGSVPMFQEFEEVLENFGLGADLYLAYGDFKWTSNNVYTLKGVNANNYQLKQNITYAISKQIELEVNSFFDRNSGNTYWEKWNTNHFRIDTALPLANYGHHGINAVFKPAKWTTTQLGLAYHLEENQRYLDTNFNLALRAYEVLPLELNQKLNFGAWEFSFGGSYFLNQDTAGVAYVGKGQIAFQTNKWFQGNLDIRFQLDYTYVPEHQLRLYEPLSRNYTDYYQASVQDNHFLNFALFAGIGKARVFVAVDNILAGIGGRYYHQASLGQFYPNRMFRFGLDWRFDY